MEKCYVMGRQLGEGADGVVSLCTHMCTGQQYACKTVSKANPLALGHIRAEIAALAKLAASHANVVASHAHFEDAQRVHLLVDLCHGGDLHHHLHRLGGRLPEPQAAQAFAALTKALSFCHRRGILHRDVKLENVLLPSPCSGHYSDLKLADFGASVDFSTKTLFHDLEGTPHYMAPEILSRLPYDEKVDLWSLGVLLHILLAGYPPFDGDSTAQIFHAIRRGRLDLRKDPWPAISADAKQLVKGLLQKNPYRGMRLLGLLAHPWVQQGTATTTSEKTRTSCRLPLQQACEGGREKGDESLCVGVAFV